MKGAKSEGYSQAGVIEVVKQRKKEIGSHIYTAPVNPVRRRSMPTKVVTQHSDIV